MVTGINEENNESYPEERKSSLQWLMPYLPSDYNDINLKKWPQQKGDVGVVISDTEDCVISEIQSVHD